MPYKILIVDDRAAFRGVFREFLTHFGYQIREASDGVQALDFLHEAHDIHLVLLDVNMPGLNGIDILAEIKMIAPELSVIILTGHNVDEISKSVPEGHVQGYIAKTSDPDEIRGLIEKVLNDQKTRAMPR